MGEWGYRYYDTGPLMTWLTEEQARRCARSDHSVIVVHRTSPDAPWQDVDSPGPDA